MVWDDKGDGGLSILARCGRYQNVINRTLQPSDLRSELIYKAPFLIMLDHVSVTISLDTYTHH